MVIMRSNILLKIILALLISLTTQFPTIHASSKETVKADNLTIKSNKSSVDKAATNWPKSSGIDAWNDEEFENDKLCDDLNSNDNSDVNFEYLLRCIK